MDTEVGVLWPQPRNACSHQKLEEARYGFSPRALEKRTLGFLNTWARERINFCHLKSSSL